MPTRYGLADEPHRGESEQTAVVRVAAGELLARGLEEAVVLGSPVKTGGIRTGSVKSADALLCKHVEYLVQFAFCRQACLFTLLSQFGGGLIRFVPRHDACIGGRDPQRLVAFRAARVFREPRV